MTPNSACRQPIATGLRVPVLRIEFNSKHWREALALPIGVQIGILVDGGHNQVCSGLAGLGRVVSHGCIFMFTKQCYGKFRPNRPIFTGHDLG